MDLSVIIVNYNAKYFLEQCLHSVLKAGTGLDAEIFVADNNSTDGSQEYLSPKFPTVQFFWNKANLGFGKANNSVLSIAKGDHILFLNPDTIVPEDCFTTCVSFFKTNTNCGSIGVRMIDGSGNFLPESKRSLPTAFSGFFKAIGFGKISGYYADHLPENKNNKTDVLAGAFMMLCKKAIEATKGFDENFFMYGEDIDLSYRITKAGMYNYYLGECTIIHFKGESTQKGSPAYSEHFYNAMKLFIVKHYSSSPIKKTFMQFGISVSKIIAKLRSSTEQNIDDKKNRRTLIAGNTPAIENAAMILNNATQFENAGNSNEADLIKTITNSNINAVVFCENGFANKSIIRQLQQLPENCIAMFHAKNSKSIVGSNDKNTRGFFITANGPQL